MFPQTERERRKGVKTITTPIMCTECNKEINILVQEGMAKLQSLNFSSILKVF